MESFPPTEKITGRDNMYIPISLSLSLSLYIFLPPTSPFPVSCMHMHSFTHPADGISYKPVAAMCNRYQEHLSEAANIVGIEQVGTISLYRCMMCVCLSRCWVSPRCLDWGITLTLYLVKVVKTCPYQGHACTHTCLLYTSDAADE